MAAIVDDGEFIVHDFDGTFYLVGNQGEIEEDLAYRYVLIRQSDANVFQLGRATDLGTAGAAIKRTIRLNYWYLLSITDEHAITPEVARRCAYMRVLGLCKGWGDIQNRPADHNCQYNDVRIVNDNDMVEVPVAVAGRIPDAHTDPTIGRNHTNAIPNYGDAIEVAWRTSVKLKLMNIVCIIAFFMRTRGHHYVDEMMERYIAVWRKCLYDEDNPGISWQHLAHHCFHFLYPDVLDGVWLNACEAATCAGALVKRVNSYPAGIAAIGAVSTGASDIAIVFPAIRTLVPDAFEELDRCEKLAASNRWAGSVNRRYYGAPNIIVDEKKLGSLAAVIVASYDGIVNTAPLKDSRALQRVAANARLTGALISQMIQKAITDDRMVDPLFIEPAVED